MMGTCFHGAEIGNSVSRLTLLLDDANFSWESFLFSSMRPACGSGALEKKCGLSEISLEESDPV